MTRTRLIAAGVITATLVGLYSWQMKREQLVRACLDSGRAWTGTACGPQPLRPILQRDLHRSQTR